MSKDGFILHEWQKDKFDALVKYNEIEDAKKEGIEKGKAEGIEEGIEKGKNIGTKEKTIEIAKNMLKKKMSIKDISEITGLTEDEVRLLIENEK